MRHQRRGPHIIAAVGTVVGAAGTGNAVQHLLVFGGMFRVVFDHPLQRLDISAGAAAFIAIRHFQQIAAHHPAGAAQHIISHQIEHRLRHGIVGTGQQIDPQRHIGKQRFAVAVGIQLISVAMEGVIYLNGFVGQPADPQIDGQIFFDHFFKLRCISGRQRPVKSILCVPQSVLSGIGGTIFVYPAQDKSHRFFGQSLFHHHTDGTEPAGYAIAVFPPVGGPGTNPVGVVGVRIFDAGPIIKGFVHPISHLLAVVIFAVFFGPSVGHGQHTVQRQIRLPRGAVGCRQSAVIIHIRPAAILVLRVQIFARFRNVANAVVRTAAVNSVVAQEILGDPLPDQIHLFLRR